jgi:spore coat polysaccharide biosynthesis predicted glycosyltransferase SpsG/CTP:molybdopterin cytidylyltransferase MocA
MKPVCAAIIPVRGGSKGIPRKNARLLDGRPLLSYAVRAAIASECFDKIVVTTDDEELEYLAAKYGADVIERPPELAGDSVGLDEVVIHAVNFLEKNAPAIDFVATIQATSPLISPATISRAVAICKRKKPDTVVSVAEDTHLGWSLNKRGILVPDYTKRVNRQYLPLHYRETGGIVVCPRSQLEKGSRFGKRVEAITLDRKEAIDIDERFDWWLAEKQLQRQSIIFRVEGHADIGLGHIYRCLALADQLLDHDLTFIVSTRSRIGINILKSHFYNVITFKNRPEELKIISSLNPDIVVNDILDTSSQYIKALKKTNCKVVNIEDQGSGGPKADVVINAMYGSTVADDNVYSGPDYMCLRDEFYSTKPIRIRQKVKNILVLFGGTDPSRLTRRVVKWILKMEFPGNITVITGPGYRDNQKLRELGAKSSNVKIVNNTKIISKYMAAADVAVTSAGRTVYELASLGIPMLVLCQNVREKSHYLVQNSEGLVNLGLGRRVTFEQFQEKLLKLIDSPDRRRSMHRALRSLKLKNGINKVWRLILSARTKSVI